MPWPPDHQISRTHDALAEKLRHNPIECWKHLTQFLKTMKSSLLELLEEQELTGERK
ncbi:MAG TPA: hypothetical protein VE844_00015 [Gammaproteobacteria bacterium]|nr:hypothetical protein [Gammaproteobacteria bacterium]